MEHKNFNLTSFVRATDQMVAKNESMGNPYSYDRFFSSFKDYKIEEINAIINSGDFEKQRVLSKNFFVKDGFYRRLILHYANLLTYGYILIPNPSFGKKLSTSHIAKRYYGALDYVDTFFTPELFTNWTIEALVNGSYYGVLTDLDKNNFTIIDLPTKYCRCKYKDLKGNNLIEFNVGYFNTILDLKERKQALSVYPNIISSYYDKWEKNKVSNAWVKIPFEKGGFSFSLTENETPFFLNVIPATVRYDDAVEVERERELEEIRKIIVQKVPHLNDGTLLFEPEEAAEMHQGSVNMMKGNKNVSVLTTYTDVDSITSRTSNESSSNNLSKMLQNIYSEAGTSLEVFSPTSSQSISHSLKNGLSLAMVLANKYSTFVTYIINAIFKNSNISFKYKILPVSYYNQSDYISDSLKLAQSGFSALIPSIAMGLSQKELMNIKSLENDELKLKEVLIPLSSSYTQSGSESDDKGGAPKKKEEEKAEQTVKNEESIANQGGSK